MSNNPSQNYPKNDPKNDKSAKPAKVENQPETAKSANSSPVRPANAPKTAAV